MHTIGEPGRSTRRVSDEHAHRVADVLEDPAQEGRVEARRRRTAAASRRPARASKRPVGPGQAARCSRARARGSSPSVDAGDVQVGEVAQQDLGLGRRTSKRMTRGSTGVILPIRLHPAPLPPRRRPSGRAAAPSAAGEGAPTRSFHWP